MIGHIRDAQESSEKMIDLAFDTENSITEALHIAEEGCCGSALVKGELAIMCGHLENCLEFYLHEVHDYQRHIASTMRSSLNALGRTLGEFEEAKSGSGE